ncbi:hypothetical protein LINPERHAP1_LOCUS28878 [Linum perenne]
MDLSERIPIRRLMASSLRMPWAKLWMGEQAVSFVHLLLWRKL